MYVVFILFHYLISLTYIPEIINTDERICCGGENLKRKGPDDICCGTALLPSRDFCVEGKIVHRDTLEDSYCSLRSDNWPFTIKRILTYNSDTYVSNQFRLFSFTSCIHEQVLVQVTKIQSSLQNEKKHKLLFLVLPHFIFFFFFFLHIVLVTSVACTKHLKV